MIKFDDYVIRFSYPHKNSKNKRRREKHATTCQLWKNSKEVNGNSNWVKLTEANVALCPEDKAVYSKNTGRVKALEKMLNKANLGDRQNEFIWAKYYEMIEPKDGCK